MANLWIRRNSSMQVDMFSRAKSEKSASAPARPLKRNQLSVLAPDMHVVGNIISEGDIQVDGRLEGDIRSQKLTVGQSAVITGTIYGDQIRIAGTVKGEIVARVVVLTSTAKVTGDIRHDSLSIDAGAFVQGLCKRVDAEQLKPPAEISLEGDMQPSAGTGGPAGSVSQAHIEGNRNTGQGSAD